MARDEPALRGALAMLSRLLPRQRAEPTERKAPELPVPVLHCGADGTVTGVNAAWTVLTGQQAPLTLGNGWLRTVHPDDVRSASRYVVGRDGERAELVRISGADGSMRHVELRRGARGGDGSCVMVATDVSHHLLNEAWLLHTATHDALTGLLTRPAFVEGAERALSRAARGASRPAVLYVDLDGFKEVNDVNGHALGDEVLRLAAERLSGEVRSTDLLARLGGDEFGVLCEDLTEDDEVLHLAQRLLDAAARPVQVDGVRVAVTASIGIAWSLGPREAVAALVNRADTAMYAAKAAGRGRWQRAEPGRDTDA